MSDIVCPPYWRKHTWLGGVQCVRCGAIKATRSERALRANICDYLDVWQMRGHGVWVDIRHPKPSAPGREGGVSRTPGAPDLFVFRQVPYIVPTPTVNPTIFPSIEALAIELKVGSGQQSDVQREWQAAFERQSGIYRLLRDESEIDAVFAQLGWPTVQEAR